MPMVGNGELPGPGIPVDKNSIYISLYNEIPYMKNFCSVNFWAVSVTPTLLRISASKLSGIYIKTVFTGAYILTFCCS